MYEMYKIKHKTSKCLWPVYIDMFGFFYVFVNNFLKIYRSGLHKVTKDLVYFWDVYDVSVWEMLAITVKLCFIETRFFL